MATIVALLVAKFLEENESEQRRSLTQRGCNAVYATYEGNYLVLAKTATVGCGLIVISNAPFPNLPLFNRNKPFQYTVHKRPLKT